MEKENLERNIAVYWWNFGSKQLDYKGTYEGFLKSKGIQLRKGKRNGFEYYRFKISAGSSEIIFVTPRSNETQALDDAIKLFLSLMGDKALFEAGYRTYRLNWN